VSPVSDAPHDPACPSLADQRAVLATARGILTHADPDAAHDYARAGDCPECTVVCALQFGFALAAQLTGHQAFVSEGLRQVLLAAVEAAQRELDSGPNLAAR
jgi:hypothetical protein